MSNISLSGIKGAGLSAPKLGNINTNNKINVDKDININQDYIEINYSDPNAETLINPNAYIDHPMQGYLNVENPYASGVDLENVRAEVAAMGVSVVFGLLEVIENIGDAAIMAGALIAVGEASVFHPEDVEKIKKSASDIVSYDWTEGLYDKTVDAMGIDYESSHGAAHTIGNIGGTMIGYTALSIGTSGAGTAANAIIGGLSAMGSSSERALQSGATFEQAEVTGLIAGGLGAVSGVAAEKIKVSSKLSNSIGDIAKYTAAGAGVAAVEPIANSGVEYLTYGKDKSDSFLDYYMNNGGFQGTLMAAGIGGASTGTYASKNYKQNLKFENEVKISKNSLFGDLGTDVNITPKINIDESIPTVKLTGNQTPTLKLMNNQTPTLKLMNNQTPTLNSSNVDNPVLRIIGVGDPTVKLFESNNISGKISIKDKLLLNKLNRTMKKGVRSSDDVLELLNSTFEKSLASGNENSTKMMKKIIQMKKNVPTFNYQIGAGGCRYESGLKTIYMSENSVAIRDGGTLIHETGHAIFDYTLNRTVPYDWNYIQDNAKNHFTSVNKNYAINGDLVSNINISRNDAISVLENKTNMFLPDIEKSLTSMYDNLLQDSNFVNSIINDASYPSYITNDLKNGIYNGRDMARHKIETEIGKIQDNNMRQNFSDDIGVSGIISSIFDGNLNDLNGNNLNIRYGHSSNYYSMDYSRSFNETYADFSKLKITGDQNSLNNLRMKLGDELYNYMDNIFNYTIKE